MHVARIRVTIAATEEDIDLSLDRIDLSLDRAAGDEPLVDSVYRTLRDAICDGRLGGNRRLAQIPLAEHLGISRTPVRDALQRLAQEGLVRAVSFRGFVVSEFSTREVLDVYEVRIALEPMAVGEAIGRYTNLNLARLQDVCESIESSPSDQIGRLYSLNADFHRGLIEPCPNRVLVRLLDQLWQMPSSLRMFHAQAALGMERSVDEHRAVLGAIEAGEAKAVVRLVTDHIRRAQQETVDALAESD